MLEKPLAEYADLLASRDAVPGGGGAAAYVGALGAALGTMVGNLTVGKKKYADVEDRVRGLMTRSEELRGRLQALSERDAEVFEPLSRAYGLPKSTPEEKAARDAVLQPALEAAARVPVEMAEALVEAIGVLAEYAEVGSQIAISDVGVGAALCRAALVSAELNVVINTRLLADERLRDELDGRARQAVADGVRQADAVVDAVAHRLKG